jgi:hypothetical protein
MDQPNCRKPTRLRTAWGGLRDFYRAWVELREMRYRYLSEALGEPTPPPREAVVRCACRERV